MLNYTSLEHVCYTVMHITSCLHENHICYNIYIIFSPSITKFSLGTVLHELRRSAEAVLCRNLSVILQLNLKEIFLRRGLTAEDITHSCSLSELTPRSLLFCVKFGASSVFHVTYLVFNKNVLQLDKITFLTKLCPARIYS